MPLANSFPRRIEPGTYAYEISVVNPSAAGAKGVGIRISGFSAGCAIFLATLSERLQIPLRQDIVVSAQISSHNGAISAVEELPAKIRAAAEDASINKIVHPNLERDGSLTTLYPTDKRMSEDALAHARNCISTSAVDDIAELLPLVFCPEDIACAAYKNDWYKPTPAANSGGNPVQRAIGFLNNNNEERLWEALALSLLEGNSERAGELLEAYIEFHIAAELYPKTIGRKLRQSLCSVPKATRVAGIKFPLLPMRLCIALSRFAGEAEGHDARTLLNAVAGEGLTCSRLVTSESEEFPPADVSMTRNVDAVMSQIDTDALARICEPIDAACNSHILPSVTVDSKEAFNDQVSGICVALVCHAKGGSPTVDLVRAGGDALSLLERAFAREGGYDGAYTEARGGVRGSMLYVKNKMAWRMQIEDMNTHINRVFKEAIEPLDPKSKAEFLGILRDRLRPFLSEEAFEMPLDARVLDIESIVRAYVSAIDKLKVVFRQH
ncbi:hypothetical protein ACFL1X_01530 [Candidatus Hydrogenedentota bacterium]